MKAIVENKSVWPLFKPVFDIPEFGDKGQAKNLKWMISINESAQGFPRTLQKNENIKSKTSTTLITFTRSSWRG